MSDKLSLPIIYNGVDSFELRIWVSGIYVKRDFISLRHSLGQWVTTKTKYSEIADKVDTALTYKISLRGDMSEIVNAFTNDETLKLPSQDAIPNFLDNVADGQSCTMEIATKRFYKSLTYHCPEYFADKELNNKKFLELIDVINKQVSFYSPYCKKSGN